MTDSLLRIQSTDQHEFQISVYKAKNACKNTVVLCLPAMGVTASYYQTLAQELSNAGFETAVSDLRGIGSSSIRASRKSNFGYLDMAKYDIPAMVTALKAEFPDHRLLILGHSLGGQLSVASLGLNPGMIDGLVLVASSSVHFKNWSFPQNLKILFLTQLAYRITQVVGYFPGKHFGFGGREAIRVMRDWSRFALTGNLDFPEFNGSIDESLASVELPVLAISLGLDTFAPKKAVESLAGKLPSAKATLVHLDKGDYPSASLTHFGWVKYPNPSIHSICDWTETTFD